MICSMYCDFSYCFFKIKCPGKIPNIQGIWEICPGNQWFQVGKYIQMVDLLEQLFGRRRLSLGNGETALLLIFLRKGI